MEPVFPGDFICPREMFTPGDGTHTRDGGIFASVLGTVVKTPDRSNNTVVVSVSGRATRKDTPHPPKQNDTVICSVKCITKEKATASILYINGVKCRYPIHATIPLASMAETQTQQKTTWSQVKPNDIVAAAVVGQSSAILQEGYLLSLRGDFGVIMAHSAATGNRMEPLSAERMRCPETKIEEKRKCLKNPEKYLEILKH
ncbi:MAG: 3'-5' exoribonuclease CSL4 [Amphiamblys sp. WSBS2006]|nr:MAG: 3'-5' exoribonuclease CSL4 [Amphiamblys sp. WSBS2006]